MSSESDSQNKGSRTVFVGNIAFDASEAALREILSTAGPLTSLRLVSDSKTGKPKGYGFAEYSSPAVAASAIRNLNNYDLNGRSLRVDYADDDKPLEQRSRRAGVGAGGAVGSGSSLSSISLSDSQAASHKRYNLGSSTAPAPHPHTTVDSITALVTSLPKNQRIDLLFEMRKLILQNPSGAKQLLIDNPQLAHTLLQIQIQFGLVKPQEIAAIQQKSQQLQQQQQQQTPTVPPPPSSAPAYPPPPSHPPHLANPSMYAPPQPIPNAYPPPLPPQPVPPSVYPPPPPPPSQYPYGYPPAPPPPQTYPPPPQPSPYAQPTHPSMQTHSHPPSAYAPPPQTQIVPPPPPPSVTGPPPPAPPPPPPPPLISAARVEQVLAGLPPQQRDALRDLLKYTPEQVAALPVEAQIQVRDILQQIMGR